MELKINFVEIKLASSLECTWSELEVTLWQTFLHCDWKRWNLRSSSCSLVSRNRLQSFPTSVYMMGPAPVRGGQARPPPESRAGVDLCVGPKWEMGIQDGQASSSSWTGSSNNQKLWEGALGGSLQVESVGEKESSRLLLSGSHDWPNINMDLRQINGRKRNKI